MGQLKTSATATPVSRPSLAFAGTPEFAVAILQALIDAGWSPSLVLTQPDRRAGRGRKRLPSPVRKAALAAALPVRTPERAAEIQPALAGTAVDVMVVAAYGLLLPRPALRHPRLGCVNVHASLLPRWRGAAPVERALMAGDRETGVTIMRMDEGLDTGPVYLQARTEIGPRTTGMALENRLAELGANMLLEVLPGLEGLTPGPQQGSATLAPKLGPQDRVPDWGQSATALDRRIRALAHRAPVVATLEGTRIQMLAARPRPTSVMAKPGTILPSDKHEIVVACGSGALSLERMKVSRGKGTAIGPRDARNGFPDLIRPGARLQ